MRRCGGYPAGRLRAAEKGREIFGRRRRRRRRSATPRERPTRELRRRRARAVGQTAAPVANGAGAHYRRLCGQPATAVNVFAETYSCRSSLQPAGCVDLRVFRRRSYVGRRYTGLNFLWHVLRRIPRRAVGVFVAAMRPPDRGPGPPVMATVVLSVLAVLLFHTEGGTAEKSKFCEYISYQPLL